jgi:hypothetical protein
MPTQYITAADLLRRNSMADCEGCGREVDDGDEPRNEMWVILNSRLLCPRCAKEEGTGPMKRRPR